MFIHYRLFDGASDERKICRTGILNTDFIVMIDTRKDESKVRYTVDYYSLIIRLNDPARRYGDMEIRCIDESESLRLYAKFINALKNENESEHEHDQNFVRRLC